MVLRVMVAGLKIFLGPSVYERLRKMAFFYSPPLITHYVYPGSKIINKNRKDL